MQYLNRTQILTVYHRSDLADEQIASDQPTHLDLGKYYGFKDGSGWYARIILVRPGYFRTTIGLHRRADLVIQSKVYFPNVNYSGCFNQDTSFKVRSASQQERKAVAKIIAKNIYPERITHRIRALLIDKIQEECANLNIDESWIVKHLYDEAVNVKNRGIERIEAVKILARLNSIETERQDPRFVTNNNFLGVQQLNIQDQRRKAVPALSAIRATIDLLKDREEATKMREVIEHEDFPVLAGKNHSSQKEMVMDAEIVEEDNGTPAS